ncbi:MAG: hypothetical protein IKC69_07130 [Clostridia bacterium]|nr:hypothetical protein [Clostridia bacterium]
MEQNNQLQIGYGRVDVTPDYPVAIAGSAAKRISEGVLDPIYITCIALRQGDLTVLFATMDLVGSYEEFTEPVRLAIAQELGLPRRRVLLNATHTHSSVSARDLNNHGIRRFYEDFLRKALACAKEAMADLAPAEPYYGSIETEGMVWVRHYKMADGSFAGANFGSFKNSAIVGHACEPDGQMQLLRFDRQKARKKDVILMNFPAHATINGSSVLLSADFPGPARDLVARETGALVAYFIAGAGNQVPTSRIPEECFSKDYRVYGEKVGRIACRGLENMTRIENPILRYSEKCFVGESNKTGLERSEDALAVSAIWKTVGGRATPEGKKAAKEYGFSSVYAVTAILNRMKFEPTRTLELHALAIGNVSMIFAPYEMFGQSAAAIKRGSPYDMTFVVSCSQNHDGYLPSTLGWELGCYEAQITRYAPGTAERLVEAYVAMLEEMKES